MNPVSQGCVEHHALPEVLIGKYLSAKELATCFGGLDEQSAYRWRSNGIIPQKYVKKFGKRNYKFHPAVTSFLENKFAEAHSRPRAARMRPVRAGAAE